jgi:hypothetical protein
MTVTQLRPQQVEHRVFDNCDGVGHAEVLEKTRISSRQLDYWTRSGRIKSHYHLRGKIVSHGGSGSIACWLPDQVKLIERVAALLRRGFELDHAFILATNLRAAEAALCELTYIQADLLKEGEHS